MPRYWLVDAFADRPFAGNPAAVLLFDAWPEPAWMQGMAAELAQPATAFVMRDGDEFRIGWFSPTTVLSLCGHGTLAAAHVLWSESLLPPTATARFAARALRLSATFRDGWVVLNFPAELALEAETPPDLAAALGCEPRRVTRNRLDYLVELDDEAAVTSVQPDLAVLRRIDTRGVIVTAPASSPGVDFVSRFFAPRAGIDEDAVTGSAHCSLGPYWADRLGRAALVGRQLSHRGGTVRVEARGDRVEIAGQAITVARGELA